MVGILIVYAAFTLVAETATGDPNTFRSTAFEDPINGKRLDAGKVIETRQEASRTKCALACSKNDDCLSFGFCGETSCELYNEDIFSTELGENILEEDANCKYFGMKKESKPVCQQDGVFADIQKNDNDERCQIAGKRVDEGWGPWVNTKIDDGVQWKITNHRDISVHVAHGGTQVDGNSEETVTWIKLVHEKKSWHDARAHCEELGGKLFHNMNGTCDQILFLMAKMNNEPHWLGIYTENHEDWKTVDGQVIDNGLLEWQYRQPYNFGGNQFYVSNRHYEWYAPADIGLADFPASDSLASVCDMM